MSVSLQKGQKVDLTKGRAGLGKIMVGLGWDPVKQGGGLFGRTPEIDCDASVFMLNAEEKLKNPAKDTVYFKNLVSPDGSVRHMGDNLTGEGEGDDEQIFVDLGAIPESVHNLVFVVNIYDSIKRNQHFGMIRNAFIRIVNSANNEELMRFSLTDDYSGRTALIVGKVYRHNGEWKFAAVGEGTNDPGLGELAKRFM